MRLQLNKHSSTMEHFVKEMAVLKVNDKTCHRSFQLKKKIVSQDLFSFICPSECTFGLSGRINEVNL